ncbi:MAG TPA: phosphatase PAP2 family protein [Verrucomicrobiae bacterium]|nr:phosphatase PAP2 family protein [Verrucomicrobiae bacterium]
MILTPSRWVLVALTALLISSVNGFAEPPFDPELKLSAAADEQDDPPPERKLYLLSYDTTNSLTKYLEWLWKDPINLVTRPIYWRTGEWTTFGIEAGITGALFPLDDPVRDVVLDNYSSSFNSSLNTVRDITGAGDYFFVAGGALFGSGLLVQNEKLADSGFLAAESVAYAGALSEGIKFLTGRERPDTGKNQYQFRRPGSGSSNSSFVSGEAIVAFAFASSVSEVWQNPWVTWPLYTFAGAAAFQRVYDNRHWLSDVVGAAFLGHTVGKELVHFHYRRDVDGVLQPYITRDTVGMQMTFRF